MNIDKIIKIKTEDTGRTLTMYQRWAADYVVAIARNEADLERLPCTDKDCRCGALHIEGWAVSIYEVIGKLQITYIPDDDGLPVGELRTAVCWALNTTMAKRKFSQATGEVEFVITAGDVEVILKKATTAPNCEIVPVVETKDVITFKIQCPDGVDQESVV